MAANEDDYNEMFDVIPGWAEKLPRRKAIQRVTDWCQTQRLMTFDKRDEEDISQECEELTSACLWQDRDLGVDTKRPDKDNDASRMSTVSA